MVVHVKSWQNRNERIKFKAQTDILLSLYVVHDETMYAVHMFPEVAYMDVTCNTNGEGRDLHLLIVEGAN